MIRRLSKWQVRFKLEKSREHAAQGKYRDAAEVFRDMMAINRNGEI